MTSNLTVQDWAGMMRQAQAAIEAARDRLNELDAAVGDGDHGSALTAAFHDALLHIEGLENPTIAAILRVTAQAIMNRIGGASGAIYGTFFLRMSVGVGDRNALTHEDAATLFRSGLDAVIARGKANPGDKTLVDALMPAVNAFEQANGSIVDAFEAAASAAHAGAEATVHMIARHGRSRFAGERSLGHMDAGSASMSVLFGAFRDYWMNKEMSVRNGEA